MRAIGGEIEGQVIGLAASVDLIAVCTYFGQVHLFDVVSGDLVRSFSERGDAEGQLFGCLGFRFTPDGSKLLIAEYNNKRLSLFSLTGELVRCIGAGGALKGPRDVDFAPNGDILVADADARNQHICVFSSDGSTLLRSFGVRGDGPGQFQAPGALAITRGELYVVDEDSTRVQVFN